MQIKANKEHAANAERPIRASFEADSKTTHRSDMHE
jgi:hypothetical protein